MGIFSEIFCWWGGNTWGTRLALATRGFRLIGEDENGNRYYEQKPGKVGPVGRPRRFVTYRSDAEASLVSPDWHGWLHYTHDKPPTEDKYTPRPWEKPHKKNMTGTPEAYRPSGSILSAAQRPKATGDYKPWRPE